MTLALRTSCALCNGPLTEAMRLADTPLANEFVTEADLGKPQETFPLTLMLCDDCGHVQLREVVSPERLFRDYCYVSGTSPVFVEHFRRYAVEMVERFRLGPDDLIVEVGSNDGTLLREFQKLGCANVLGIDPAEEIAAAARASGVPTRPLFFGEKTTECVRAEYGSAKLIIANNVFAHTADLQGFTRAVKSLLAPDGVFVFEVSYLLDVVEKMLFDTIYHEHLSYHALGPLDLFFDRFDLGLFDVELVPTHGGSIRCFVTHGEAAMVTSRLEALTREELTDDWHPYLNDLGTFALLERRIRNRGDELRAAVLAARAEGKRVAGFCAPAKLTTLMYEFGLGASDIDFIVDDSPMKQGRFTPGTHIPVLPTSALYERMPDVCVIFAWNFADSIIEKHRAYVEAGGRFIVPLPALREVSHGVNELAAQKTT